MLTRSVLSWRGHRICVSETGEGEPLLLVPGLGCSADVWAPFIEQIEARRIVSFDAPGAGRSSTPSLPVSVGALAALAVAVLDDRGIDCTDVVGFSYGGAIAQQLAHDYPARVARLVLAATTCGVGAMPGIARGDGRARDAAAVLFAALLRTHGRRLVRRRDRARSGSSEPAHGPALQPSADAVRLCDAAARRRAVVELAISRGHPARDARDRAATTIRSCRSRTPQFLAGLIPRARLEVVPRAGHLFLWDDAERTAPRIAAFVAPALGRLASARRSGHTARRMDARMILGFVVATTLSLCAVAMPLPAAEVFDFGLATSGRTLEASFVPARSESAPTVLLIGGLRGDDGSAAAVRAARRRARASSLARARSERARAAARESGRRAIAISARGRRVSRAVRVARAVALDRDAGARPRTDRGRHRARRRRRLRARDRPRRAYGRRRRPHPEPPLDRARRPARARGRRHPEVRGTSRDRTAPRALAAAARGRARRALRPRLRPALVHRRDCAHSAGTARRPRRRPAARRAVRERREGQPRAAELVSDGGAHRVHRACAPHRRSALRRDGAQGRRPRLRRERADA